MWGNNVNGILGQNDTNKRSSPAQIPGTWEYVSTGSRATMAKKTDGTLWSWGYNYAGMLGLNTTNPGNHHSSPVQIPGGWVEGVDSFVCAYGHGMALGKM